MCSGCWTIVLFFLVIWVTKNRCGSKGSDLWIVVRGTRWTGQHIR